MRASRGSPSGAAAGVRASLDASWGYQPIGLFAPTRAFGEAEGFKRFVDRAHSQGIGVILDWVPAHFPTDEHGLAWFDGAPLYENADPQRGFQPDWNTAIYDFGRREVANFLAVNALYWFENFHIDGLRVDAVASMLYPRLFAQARRMGRRTSTAQRKSRGHRLSPAGQQAGLRALPRRADDRGGIDLLSGVSHPVHAGGLGFGFKWNMGWMNDTLRYIAQDPIFRRWGHDRLTFGLLYAFAENFILPISHDEVVHGKGSLIGKMPGDEWRRFANARAYFAFMWGHPGKKLLSWTGSSARPANGARSARSTGICCNSGPMRPGTAWCATSTTCIAPTRPCTARDCEADASNGWWWTIRKTLCSLWLRARRPG